MECFDILKKKRILTLFPLGLINIYIFFTLAVYLFGPWDFSNDNKYLTVTFIIVYILSINAGFIFGIFGTRNKSRIDTKNIELYFSRWLLFLLLASIFFNVFYILRNTGGNAFSIYYIYEQAFAGIVNPGEQYLKKFSSDALSSVGGGILPKIYVLLSPLIWASLPVSILYWKRLKVTNKLLVACAILTEIIKWISIGTNKGIIDLVIIFVIVILAIYFKKAFDGKLERKKIISQFLTLSVLSILALVYFNNAIGSRIGVNYSALLYNVPINENSILFKIIPENFHFFIISISAYLTQGYYAISMSFLVPFSSTLGMGSSLFLYENFKSITGERIWENSYVYKLSELGWDQQVNWHSLYLWLANDWSYFGVIPIMFLLGLMFSLIWKDFLFNYSSISIILLPLYAMIFIYSPANNQVMQTPNLFVSFWVWNFVFVYSNYIRPRSLKTQE